jgi:hypothetical protein
VIQVSFGQRLSSFNNQPEVIQGSFGKYDFNDQPGPE